MNFFAGYLRDNIKLRHIDWLRFAQCQNMMIIFKIEASKEEIK